MAPTDGVRSVAPAVAQTPQQAAADQAAAEATTAAVAQRKQAAATAAVQASGLRIAPSATEWEKQWAEALAVAQVRCMEWRRGGDYVDGC